jgi:hypothetical protein
LREWPPFVPHFTCLGKRRHLDQKAVVTVCSSSLSQNEAFDQHTFDPIETIHIPITGTCTEGHDFNPYVSMCYAPDDLDLVPGFPKDHCSMGLTTWDVRPSIPSPNSYSWPADMLSSMAYHGNESLKVPDDSHLVRMRPFLCHRSGCLGTVTSIESGGDKIHFNVEPTRTDESNGKENYRSYRAVITAWRETDPGEGDTETETETNKEILLSQPAIVWSPPPVGLRINNWNISRGSRV